MNKAKPTGVRADQLVMSRTFFENGGQSLNALLAVRRLADEASLHVDVSHFLSKPLGELLLVPDAASLTRTPSGQSYRLVELHECDRDQVADMIGLCMWTSAELDRYLEGTLVSDVAEVIRAPWDDYVAAGMSYAFVDDDDDEDGRLLAVSISFDARVDPRGLGEAIEASRHMRIIGSLLERLSAPTLERLPKESGVVWSAFVDVVDLELAASLKVELMFELQREQARRAERLGYRFVLADNISPLTQVSVCRLPVHSVVGRGVRFCVGETEYRITAFSYEWRKETMVGRQSSWTRCNETEKRNICPG